MPALEWVEANWPSSAKVLAVRCQGSRDGKLVDETRYDITSLPTSANPGGLPHAVGIAAASARPLVD